MAEEVTGSIKDLGHKAKGVAAETHKELAKKAEEFVCECDEQCSCMQTAGNPTTGTVRECDEKCSCKRNQHHGWLDNVAEEVKEDAKYLTRKASDAAEVVFSSIGHTFETVNQSCHHAVDYVRGTSTAEKEPCDETSVKEDHKASLDSSPGEHKTEPKEKSPVHNWFGYVADEVKEDAKYLQKKAGDAAEMLGSSIEHTYENAVDFVTGSPDEKAKTPDEVDAPKDEKVDSDKKLPENPAQKLADAINGPPEPESHSWLDDIGKEVKEDALYLQRKAGDATETVLSTIGSTFRSTSHDSVEKACQDIEAEKEAKKKAISDKVDMVDGKIGEFSEAITKGSEKSHKLEI